MNDLVLLDLQTDISVGNITTNAALLLDAVKHGVAKYHNPNYIPDEATAKTDRAELNRAERLVADKAKEVKDKWNEPLETFNSLVAEIRSTIKDASGVVDNSVKAYEEKQKKEKREEIEKYFALKQFELIPLDRIFDKKWLNKTCKMYEVKKEMDAIIDKIYKDIEVLERLPEHGTSAKAFYLETLDMGEALRQIDVLKENAERLAREETSRTERKITEQVDKNIASLKKEKYEEVKTQRAQGYVDDMLGLPKGTTAAQSKDDIISYTLTFRQKN